MALTADQIVTLSLESAHSPGKVDQGRALLNSVLSDACQIYDFAEARGQFFFNFNPSLRVASPPGWPGTAFGSGPYPLPVDYLRLSGSSGSSGSQRSFIWYLDGVPYPVIPCDLAEFDMQVQQSGLQSFVWLGATDMATPIDDRIILSTTANLTAGSTTAVFLASTTRLIGGSVLGIAGQGIVPGTMLVSVSGDTIVMSQPANATLTGASIFFGYPPTVLIYPPPSSAQLAMIRYQKRMPDIADFTRFPWLHFDGYLIDKVTGRLCQLNDDSRADRLLGGPDVAGSADHKLALYLAAKDDDPSHPKMVQLDRRTFGTQFQLLKSTKKVGWG